MKNSFLITALFVFSICACTKDALVDPATGNTSLVNSTLNGPPPDVFLPCLYVEELEDAVLPASVSAYLATNYGTATDVEVYVLSTSLLGVEQEDNEQGQHQFEERDTLPPLSSGDFIMVELSDSTLLLFDYLGTFLESHIGESSVILDINNLSAEILDYVAATFPGLSITRAERDLLFGIASTEVFVGDSIQLIFDEFGTLMCMQTDDLEHGDRHDDSDHGSNNDGKDHDEDGKDHGDNHGSDDGMSVLVSELPALIVDYVTANYPASTIKKAEKEASEYHIDLSTGEELIFDLAGTFLRKE